MQRVRGIRIDVAPGREGDGHLLARNRSGTDRDAFDRNIGSGAGVDSAAVRGFEVDTRREGGSGEVQRAISLEHDSIAAEAAQVGGHSLRIRRVHREDEIRGGIPTHIGDDGGNLTIREARRIETEAGASGDGRADSTGGDGGRLVEDQATGRHGRAASVGVDAGEGFGARSLFDDRDGVGGAVFDDAAKGEIDRIVDGEGGVGGAIVGETLAVDGTVVDAAEACDGLVAAVEVEGSPVEGVNSDDEGTGGAEDVIRATDAKGAVEDFGCAAPGVATAGEGDHAGIFVAHDEPCRAASAGVADCSGDSEGGAVEGADTILIVPGEVDVAGPGVVSGLALQSTSGVGTESGEVDGFTGDGDISGEFDTAAVEHGGIAGGRSETSGVGDTEGSTANGEGAVGGVRDVKGERAGAPLLEAASGQTSGDLGGDRAGALDEVVGVPESERAGVVGDDQAAAAQSAGGAAGTEDQRGSGGYGSISVEGVVSGEYNGSATGDYEVPASAADDGDCDALGKMSVRVESTAAGQDVEGEAAIRGADPVFGVVGVVGAERAAIEVQNVIGATGAVENHAGLQHASAVDVDGTHSAAGGEDSERGNVGCESGAAVDGERSGGCGVATREYGEFTGGGEVAPVENQGAISLGGRPRGADQCGLGSAEGEGAPGNGEAAARAGTIADDEGPAVVHRRVTLIVVGGAVDVPAPAGDGGTE